MRLVLRPLYESVNWLILRGFLVDGKPDAASKMFRERLKVYPLSKAGNPPKMEFINTSKVPYNTIHANTFAFYEELDRVIQKEPLDLLDPAERGVERVHSGRGFPGHGGSPAAPERTAGRGSGGAVPDWK